MIIKKDQNLKKYKHQYISFSPTISAQNRNRTSDTRIFSPLLYQLSYLGISWKFQVVAGTGFEPVTSGLWARRASRLLHPAILIKNGWRWIRTTEAKCSRFTVCPLWPLGNPSIIGITTIFNCTSLYQQRYRLYHNAFVMSSSFLLNKIIFSA